MPRRDIPDPYFTSHIGAVAEDAPGGRRYRAAAERIADAIRKAPFIPGDLLPPERELAERLGVSRSTVREAVAVLETLGVVAVRSNHGIEVTAAARSTGLPWRDGAAATPRQQFEALRFAEAALVGTFEGASEPPKAPLALDLAGMQDAVDFEMADYDQRRVGFHCSLAARSPNPVLGRWVRELWMAQEGPEWRRLNGRLSAPEDRRQEIRLLRQLLEGLGSKGVAERRAESYFGFLEGKWFPDRSSEALITGFS